MVEKRDLVWVVCGEDMEKGKTTVNGVYEDAKDADATIKELVKQNRRNKGNIRWYRTQEVFSKKK